MKRKSARGNQAGRFPRSRRHGATAADDPRRTRAPNIVPEPTVICLSRRPGESSPSGDAPRILTRRFLMASRSWIRTLFSRPVTRTIRKAPGHYRPRVEALEDRLDPAILTVNSTLDTANPSDQYLSLREAIALVNSDTLPSGPSAQITDQISGTLHAGGTDTIQFDPTQVTAPIKLGGTQLELSLPGSTAAITIDGGAAGVTVDGNHASRVFQVSSGVQATLTNLTIAHGSFSGGGGISNNGTLLVTNSTLSDNFALAGGGIENVGTLTVSNSTLSGNSGGEDAGGISNSGTLTISNSTLSGNSSILGGGILTTGTLTITNSTLSGNSAFFRGGIFNRGALTVTNSTLSGNFAPFGGLGGGIYNIGALTLNNSIVANSPSGGDLSGGYSGGHNLFNTVALGPLQDNGGPTLTMALPAGSPAIDAGDNALAVDANGQPLTTDQRGFPRFGGTVDIGAVETQVLTASTVAVAATAGSPFSGAVATFTSSIPGSLASQFAATIDWGDGSTSSGVITGSGSFSVSGSHTYADPGNPTVLVTISHQRGYTPPATTSSTATVTSLGQSVQKGLAGGIGFWQNGNGQALINSFNGGATATALSAWLAASFPNLYGAGAGANNLAGKSNAQVAAFYLSQFALPGPKVEAQTLALALNVYATTLSLGGTAAQAYGFTVSAAGLGARSFNVGGAGAAFGVANNTTLNVYQLLLAVNNQAVNGVPYNGDGVVREQAADLFDALDLVGGI